MADQNLRDEDRQPCEIWTRIMGYYRPKDSANIGKRGEFADRKYFKEPEVLTAEPDGG